MKPLFILSILISVIVMQSCEAPPSNDKRPEVSSITLNRTRIGLGQPVTFSIHETTPATAEISERKSFWNISGNIFSYEGEYKNGLFSRTLASQQLGTNTIKVKIEYTLSRASGKDASLLQTAEEEKTFEVIECDARTSFWGDSQAETLINVPSAKSSSSAPHMLISIGSSSAHPNSTSVQHERIITYTFANDKLQQITEIQDIKSISQPSKKIYLNSFAIENRYFAEIFNNEVKVTWVPTWKNETTIDEKYKLAYNAVATDFQKSSDEQRDLVGEAIFNGELTIHSDYTTPKTKINFKVSREKIGLEFVVSYIATLTPKN